MAEGQHVRIYVAGKPGGGSVGAVERAAHQSPVGQDGALGSAGGAACKEYCGGVVFVDLSHGCLFVCALCDGEYLAGNALYCSHIVRTSGNRFDLELEAAAGNGLRRELGREHQHGITGAGHGQEHLHGLGGCAVKHGHHVALLKS